MKLRKRRKKKDNERDARNSSTSDKSREIIGRVSREEKAHGTCRVAFGRNPMELKCFNPYTPLFMLPQWIQTSGALAAIAVKAGDREDAKDGR